jgi:GTP:adenosylcobinamide-phosphate guanylyltransferase
MPASNWRAIVLAASRGPDDPMAKAYGVQHKCALPVGGVPMLSRVVEALNQAGIPSPHVVVIETREAAQAGLPQRMSHVSIVTPKASAPESAKTALQHLNHFPALITTGDHALLTPEILAHYIAQAENAAVDVTVGLATSDIISKSYPETRRTYFNLGGTRVSGCNLFAVMNAEGLKLVEAWQMVDRNRKKPWRLVAQFGFKPLLYLILGKLTPDKAFALASEKLGAKVAPVFLPFAEAAIDVDKPSDLELAEKILQARDPQAQPATR